MKNSDFYLDNRIESASRRMHFYCDGLAQQHDNVPYLVDCGCGNVATCYEIQTNNPQPTFLCDSCSQIRKQAIGSSGVVCSVYADLFVAFPGRSAIDSDLRDKVLRYLREAKGFRKYVTARKSKRFLRRR